MNKKNQIFVVSVALIIVVAFIFYFYSKNHSTQNSSTATSSVENFYECVDAGFPTTSAYPRQCQIPNSGTIYVEDLLPGGLPPSTTSNTSTTSLSYKDLIKVSNIHSGETIKSPVLIEGEARGAWYFEASFPISIVDSNGQEVGQGHATANGDWTTSSYVPFSATISFNVPGGEKGAIVLKKDNPSGDPIRDDSFSIPVVFQK